MNEITFFAPGLPKGQPRPRAFARKMGDKFVARVYDAGTAEGWKSEVAIAAKQHLPEQPISFPVAVSLIFAMPRPKGHYRTGKNAGLLRADAPFHHTAKPDVDNLYKGTADCLTAIGFFRDDSFIVEAMIIKLYASGQRSGCQITIRQATILPNT